MLHTIPSLRRGGEVLQDAGREGERVDDKRPGAPSGKGDAEGQAEIPTSSDFTHACEANASAQVTRNRALAGGASAYLNKPVPAEMLLDAIAAATSQPPAAAGSADNLAVNRHHPKL